MIKNNVKIITKFDTFIEYIKNKYGKDFLDSKMLISYHRGMEHSKVIYGNKIFVNDILITIDG